MNVEFTGERVIPDQGDVDLFNEHRARYLFAGRFASGKTVLDAACGTGYGSALLAEVARTVVGADIARDAIEYARQHFASPNVHFAQADCLTLPFSTGRFDLIVAFEIIEHLDDAEGFLSELRRGLDPAGLLILSTPNRLYYTDDRGELNPFHRREFSYPEFEEILRPLFPHRAILFENHVAGLTVSGPEATPNFAASSAGRIVQEEASTPSVVVSASLSTVAAGREQEPNRSPQEEEQRAAHFFIALCSARPLGPIEPLLYLPSTGNVVREREIHIHRLRDQLQEVHAGLQRASQQIQRLQQREEELNHRVEERTQWAQDLDRRLSEREAYALQLQADYDRKIEWAQSLEQDLEKTRAALQSLQDDYDRKIEWARSLEADVEKSRAALQELRQEFEERTAWALKLNAELEERTAWALRLDAELKERSEDLRLLYGSKWYRLGKNLKLSPVPPSDRGPSEAGPR